MQQHGSPDFEQGLFPSILAAVGPKKNILRRCPSDAMDAPGFISEYLSISSSPRVPKNGNDHSRSDFVGECTKPNIIEVVWPPIVEALKFVPQRREQVTLKEKVVDAFGGTTKRAIISNGNGAPESSFVSVDTVFIREPKKYYAFVRSVVLPDGRCKLINGLVSPESGVDQLSR